MDMNAVRRKNLARVVEEVGTMTAVAERADMSIQHISQLVGGRAAFGERTARRLEQALGLEMGRLDRHGEPGADLAGLGDEEIALAQRIGRLTTRERSAVVAMVDRLLAA